MIIKNISKAKAQLSSLIEQVLKGNEILIGKAGRPIAKLVPYKGTNLPRKPGALKGKIKMSKDFDKLPDELLEAFGVK